MSPFADFCAAKEIPNRADHIPHALRSRKAEIWGSYWHLESFRSCKGDPIFVRNARFKNSIGRRRSPFCPPRILQSSKHAEQIPDQWCGARLGRADPLKM